MNPIDHSRLHAARMRNDETKYRMDDMRPRFDRYRDRHTNGSAPRSYSAFQLFQTPEALAARMVEIANIGPDSHVLEPSAGLGRLLRPILARNPASVTACEIDAELSGELFREFPTVQLLQRDFLEVPPAREGNAGTIVKQTPRPFYTHVVMNPPFHMRADIRHTLHALQFLHTGGTIVGLCMDTRHRAESLKPLSDHWEEIPAGTFSESGTGVACILFRIRP